MRQDGPERFWYRQHPLRFFLAPFAALYRLAVLLRRRWLVWAVQQSFPVPVIVVGNLTVGGVGKTPLLLAIAEKFHKEGIRLCIVSRGYGGKARHYPHWVKPEERAEEVGDEPLLLAQKSGCPVIIDRKRARAVAFAIEKFQPQLILSDDGLQHYAMGRSLEILVLDGKRGLGNGFCLPAGPLREPASRLQEVDFLVVNGGTWPHAYRMELQEQSLYPLHQREQVLAFADLPRPVYALAALGNPERFFSMVQKHIPECQCQSYPDHSPFPPEDLAIAQGCILMTEKDAVKCQNYAPENCYALAVQACLPTVFWQALRSHRALANL